MPDRNDPNAIDNFYSIKARPAGRKSEMFEVKFHETSSCPAEELGEFTSWLKAFGFVIRSLAGRRKRINRIIVVTKDSLS